MQECLSPPTLTNEEGTEYRAKLGCSTERYSSIAERVVLKHLHASARARRDIDEQGSSDHVSFGR